MKNIVLIQSHCDTEEKLEYLTGNINKIKKFDVDILLFSHITLPQEIIELVDYFIFDKSNPILWDERRHYFWWVDGGYKLETTIPDYGWTVFNQIIKSGNMISNCDYNFVYVMNYDVIIDENIVNFFEKPQNCLFKHSKPQEKEIENVEFKVGLIFFILEFKIFKNLISKLTKKEYSDNWNLIAEEYLINKLTEIGFNPITNFIVKDYFHQTNNIFDLKKNPNFEIFIDNQDLLKFRFSKKINKSMYLIINDKLISNFDDTFFYQENLKQIKNFGVLIENEYINLINLFSEKKINKITPIN